MWEKGTAWNEVKGQAKPSQDKTRHEKWSALCNLSAQLGRRGATMQVSKKHKTVRDWIYGLENNM